MTVAFGNVPELPSGQEKDVNTAAIPVQTDTRSHDYKRRALEVFIHVGLVVLLLAACLLIVRPFIPLIAWGIVIAIATHPAYKKLRSWMGGRGSLAAIVVTLAFLAILIVPAVFALSAWIWFRSTRSSGWLT